MTNTTASPRFRGIAAALVAAQANLPAVTKDGVNPHYSSRFVTLDALIEATRPVLNRHGLAIVQSPTHLNAQPALKTIILHGESGEELSSVMPLLLDGGNMQKLGAALTYARRYAWAAALGIAEQDDDDGENASKPAKSTSKPTRAQMNNIWRLITKLHETGVIDRDTLTDAISKEYDVGGISELTPTQASNLIDRLKVRASEDKPGYNSSPPASDDIPFGEPDVDRREEQEVIEVLEAMTDTTSAS